MLAQAAPKGATAFTVSPMGTVNQRPPSREQPAPDTPPLRPKTLGPTDAAMRPLDELRRIWAVESCWSLFERVILTLLVLNADNSTKIAVRPLPWLATQARISRSTLIRTLNGLECVRKAISRETKKKPHGVKNEVTRYQLHLDAFAHLASSSPPETPPSPKRPPWGGPAVAVAEGVSCMDPDSVPQTLDLLRPLPGTSEITVAAPDPEPVPPISQIDPAPIPAAAASFQDVDRAQNDSSSERKPVVAELNAVILAELRAHEVLAPLSQPRHLEALVHAAQKTPIPLVRTALRQLAAKVGRGAVRALPAVAIGFITHVVEVDPMLAHAQESERQSDAHKQRGRGDHLLETIAQRAQEDQERAAKLTRARSAIAGGGEPPLQFIPPPAALAHLAARADALDAVAEGQVFSVFRRRL